MVALSHHNARDLQRLLALVRRNEMFESCANLCHFSPANLRVLSLTATVAVVKNPPGQDFESYGMLICVLQPLTESLQSSEEFGKLIMY